MSKLVFKSSRNCPHIEYFIGLKFYFITWTQTRHTITNFVRVNDQKFFLQVHCPVLLVTHKINAKIGISLAK